MVTIWSPLLPAAYSRSDAQASKKHFQLYHGLTPSSLGNETSAWSPFAPHQKHTHVFPDLEQENEAGKILGNWYSLPAIHLISPAIS